MNSENHILKVGSPLSGWCDSLDDSPDPVFRDRILGDGVSIDPTEGMIRAPFAGEVLTLPASRHAINLRAENGAEFLIHVGIDTVGLAGEGFDAHVAPGDRVECGQLLLSFDMEKVLRGASSLKTPVLLLSDGFKMERKEKAGLVKPGDSIFEVHPLDEDSGAESNDGDAGDISEQLTKLVAVGLEHGIHARPAASLKAAIENLEATVTCQLHDLPPANARSPVALMSQSIVCGDVITVAASGRDAQPALEAVVSLLEPLDMDEVELAAKAHPPSSAHLVREPVRPLVDGAVIRAQPASPGLCMGGVYVLETWDAPAGDKPETVAEEREKLADATETVRSHLEELANPHGATGGGTGAEIAIAHLALLEDPMITDPANEWLERGKSASMAWHEAIKQSVEALLKVDDRRMRERVDDLKDMNLRVQRALAGQDPGQGPDLPEKSVVIADKLLPSQLLELDHSRVVGICTSAGGTTSHVAILAIALGIPMLVAAGEEILGLGNGDQLLLDADYGELKVRPDAAAAESFERRMREESSRHELEKAAAMDKCRTRDGTRIHFHANLASTADAVAAVQAGAEGCGLLRTEFIFMSRARAPGMEQQLETYQQISEVLQDRPMVVRTLDAGGDKPISYLDQAEEENPALGVRGIRLSLGNRSLLETQLEAFLRLERKTALQVMIPMVTSVHEVTEVREIIESLCQQHGLDNRIRLGIMIETPAAALIANQLASLVDFFSVGTNDLTQYTLSMDRGEPRLAMHLDVLHPAVLQLIRKTVEAADEAGIPVAVCGGAAGDLMSAPVLLGLGIRELSMPQSLIARQKARLREVSLADCTGLAEKALSMDSARSVRAMMRDFYGN